MLKILQITNKAPYPANDGSSIAIYNMARGLLQNGVSLQLLAINTKKNFKPDEAVPAEFRNSTSYISVYRNTSVHFFGALFNLFSRQSYFVSRFRFRSFSSVLTKLLREGDFDIVQLEGLFMAVYIPVIRSNSKARIVLRAHNIEHVIWNRHILQEPSFFKKWYLALQNRRLKKFELKVLNEVDAIVPISGTDENSIRELGCPTKLFTCITGIVPEEYKKPADISPKKDSVFYFGSMDWLPNQEAVAWFLKNCWEDVKKEVPSAKFIIAGRGMPLHFFHFNMPGVSLVEEVDDPHAFFHRHQVMVVPLWSGSGLRIKIVEGMACGKVIVSTSIGAEGIACTSGKDILIADTAAEFVQHVVQLLRNEALQKEVGDNAAALAAAEFNNAGLVASLVRFYSHFIHA